MVKNDAHRWNLKGFKAASGTSQPTDRFVYRFVHDRAAVRQSKEVASRPIGRYVWVVLMVLDNLFQHMGYVATAAALVTLLAVAALPAAASVVQHRRAGARE